MICTETQKKNLIRRIENYTLMNKKQKEGTKINVTQNSVDL